MSNVNWTFAELEPGEVALCLRVNDTLHIMKEHLTPEQAVDLLKDVMTGKITPEQIKHMAWRQVKMSDAQFIGEEVIDVPSVREWPHA